jgi:valyl-tRNA synthetase
MQLGDSVMETEKLNSKNFSPADKKIIKKLEETTDSINKNLQKFEFGQASHLIYDFFWHDFCDEYIEVSKSEIGKEKSETKNVLSYILLSSLKLLHPFVPFITEEIYQKLPIKNKKEFLMIETWPTGNKQV